LERHLFSVVRQAVRSVQGDEDEARAGGGLAVAGESGRDERKDESADEHCECEKNSGRFAGHLNLRGSGHGRLARVFTYNSIAIRASGNPPKKGGPAPASRRGRARLGCGMALRICLVTPFAWSQPHDVNEHVAGVAQELRALGHAVTILASSNRAADLAAGRRALQNGTPDGELIAVGPAVPISRRSRVGVPVGVRANLTLALANGRYDVVHGFEPALPSLPYLALP